MGRVTDIFGRRWFFVGGSLLAIIGNIVCATAQNIPVLIGGMTMVGAGKATILTVLWYEVLMEL